MKTAVTSRNKLKLVEIALLVGLAANFISGWATELTTRMVEKQQGVTLSRQFKTAE